MSGEKKSEHGYGAYNPQVINFTLKFWESGNKWAYEEPPFKEIRFRVLGQSYGKNRWRPHLIQYRDILPNQSKKEANSMLSMLQQTISTLTNATCMTITMDLLDYWEHEVI